MDWNKLTFAVMILSVVLIYLRTRMDSPVLSVFSHWVRWIFLSLAFAYISIHFGLMDKPFEVLALIGFLGWFILETVYHWLTIRMLSKSSMNFFPIFKLNHAGDEWPNLNRLVKLRQWLRDQKFKQIASLKSDIFAGISLRSSIYYNPSQLTRLQILFVPMRDRGVSTYYILTSRAESGTRLITDNVHMPFAGYYPENWFSWRKPMIRDLSTLYSIHEARLKEVTESLVAWGPEPLDDVNGAQRALEQTNRDRGFLFPTHLHEDYGQITPEGRYRIWKEIWFLKYLGLSLSRAS